MGNGKSWDDSVQIAKNMLSGNFKPKTEATHYLNTKKCIELYGKLPRWYDKSKVLATIEDHEFLKVK